ncbi:hypothetical protein FHL15_008559 [Xylaria flabelliformis]|uniref:Protein kinase domain-containing protein n=1 Tax=Xylaria flabelliformis TaxID=2512241 RepID=A0A553HRL0_9PEZI|nr:hypothetical protein FHL15_008559 [Xylaria flabelliformis]
MEPHSVSNSRPSPAQIEYQSAIQFYSTVRDENTLKEADDIGGRPFVLVENVTFILLGHKRDNSGEHGQISRLLEASYRRRDHNPPLQRSYQILDRLPIFYTLLDLDLGNKIHKFVEEGISRLPIELPKLKTLFPAKKYDDAAERFYKQQWRWCAMRFEWRMSRKAPSHEHIIPITARLRIEPSRDGLPKTDRKSSLWVVEVPTSLVDKKIEEKLGLPDDDDNTEDNPTREASSKGIVQYIGWYTHREKNPNSDTETTYYNLVLELGAQDLYSAFQKENPPITFSEIQVFWKSMFNVADALASIQVMQHGLYTTYLWHGDIKPENILDVRGRFKLADPGEARVKIVTKPPSGEIPKISVPGGTRSFAAPEKFTYHPDRHVEPEVTQGSDIWSLGCVFSVAATYVVLGKEGVKQYRLLRQRKIESLGTGIGDPFHDREQVLPVVIDWHKYLRNTLRRDDCYTAKVLDLVDTRMLITPGEDRISGASLSQELKGIDEKATQTVDGFPDYIAEFIDNVTHNFKEGIFELEDVPRTISKSGRELFSEELLYRSRRSEGRPMARHMQPSPGDPLRGIGTSLDPNPVLTVPERISGFFTKDQRGALTSLDHTPQETPLKPPDPPTTFWEVEDHIMEYRAHHKDYFNLDHYLKKHKSVYGKSLGGKEDQLQDHFKNRDIVYLVDNASSMKRFWQHASYLLKVLVMRSLGYDDNGMELRFTNDVDGKWTLNPKKNQKPEDFLARMVDADPKKRRFSITETDMTASLTLILENHLKNNSDGRRLKRHLTILVLTDGLWEINKEYDVDNYLVTFIKRIPEENWEPETPVGMSNKLPSRPRPISIQFIRFGHHPDAILRLNRLDNELKDRPELLGTSIPRDIIDTEDANMDVYKMFLGSFIEDFDNKAIQGAPVVSSTSGRSVTFPTNGPEMNGMSPGEYDMPQTPVHTSARTSAGPFSPPGIHRQSSVPGRPPFPWSSPPQTYTSSRAPPLSSESSPVIPELVQAPLAHRYRHGSVDYTASSPASGAYSHYTRPRGESQGQHSKASSPFTYVPSVDPFNTG